MENAVIGVSISGKVLVAGKVKEGKIENSISRRINNKASENEVLAEVFDIINEVKDNEVAGIGIGVPSLVDVEKGIVYQVQNIPSWREVHIREILESHFGMKVYVNNDANCFAIGEMYFGKTSGYENSVGLILGAGVGAGIIFKGHLYSGTNCGAGEFGDIPYRNENYEFYLNDAYFEYKYGLSANTLLKRANKKDKIALAIFEQYGYDLGNLIKTVLFSVDPEIVVIGGSLSKAFPYFEKSMTEKMTTFPYKHAVNKLKVVASEQEDIAVLGAAALYFDAHNQQLKK
ncbi:MAG: ROK family protein [Bacteroidetes bacterium]|nr:MAG: ROK family protein [Bacteroidota bacterium]